MMREGGARWFWALCLSSLGGPCAAFGCRRGDEVDKVAELVDLRGSVVRDFAAHPNDWKPAAIDQVLSIGDGVHTASESSARVRFFGGGTLKLGGDTLIRFLLRGDADKGQRVSIETGLAEIEPAGDSLLFETRFGHLIIERGSTVRVTTEGDRIRFQVLVGGAVFERDGGGSVIARPGDTFAVDMGSIVIEKAGSQPADTQPESATELAPDGGPSSGPEHPPNAATQSAPLAPEMPSASRVDVVVEAGESATIHDIRAPTAVRIRTSGICPGDALLEIADGRKRYKRAPLATASSGSTVMLAAGAHPYRVRCVAGQTVVASPVTTGTLRIVKDSGAARISRTAPRNVIEADGRRYRVLYQSVLPELTFLWPSAPSAASFMLHVAPAQGAAISTAAEGATHSFKSGALAEGSYLFWFEADDAKRTRSPTSNLRIDFDNAAPAAEIRSPPARASAPVGGLVTVAGIAIEGATVAVDGMNLPLDSQQRFRAEMAVEGRSALAIRIGHASRGIHYYVRRLGE
jgi:hypothetical protein